MAKDEAYRIAEKKIEEARRTGAKELDLGVKHNKSPRLTEVPERLCYLVQLEKLYLDNNELMMLPDRLCWLTQLKELNLSGNQLTALPGSLCQLTQLQRLSISDNQLTELPEWLSQLSLLQCLYLGGNQLTALPDWLGKLLLLQILELTNNQLTALPESLGQLTQLQMLFLAGNRLTALPDWLGQLTQLQKMFLACNQLTTLPESVGHLSQLQRLFLGGNQLTALPESLGHLSQLQILVLDDNQLTALPESLGQLSQLQEVHLNKNQLTVLPESIKDLRNLVALFLHDNPALNLPVDILGPSWHEIANNNEPADPAAIIDFYFTARSGGRPLNEVRLVLVGRGGAGKTSLVERLVCNKFDPHQKETLGVALCDWQIEDCPGGKVLAHVWDFAGQTITHSMHQFFLSARTAYVLVLTGRENSEREDAEYWLRLIAAYGTDSAEKKGPPVIVALNKWNDPGSAHASIDRNALQERYPFIVGFVETDCETATGIPELRELVCDTLDQLPWVRTRFPEEYRLVKERLQAVNDPHLAYDDYRVICMECGVVDETKQDLLAKNLHALGVALNFRDDERLRFASVLKPHWLTENVYALVRSAEARQGILQREELPTILAKVQDEAIQQFLVEMMARFELAYPLTEDDATAIEWLVPQALPDSQPAEVSEFRNVKDATRLQYRYRALPVSIVPRFIVRTHPFIEKTLRWKSGVVLIREGARALVRADYMEKTVEVTVTGPAEARQELAGLAQRELRLINGEIKGLNPTEEMLAEGEWVPVKTLESDEKAKRPTGIATDEGTVSKNPTVMLNEFSAPAARDNSWKPKLFISYSHKDEALRKKLDLQLIILANGGVLHERWHDRMIQPGDDWDRKIKAEMEAADVVVFLISNEALASGYIQAYEMKRAFEREAEGKTVVVPVILEDSQWNLFGFKKNQALPKDAKPVRKWRPQNDGWTDVSRGLRALLEGLRQKNGMR